ncbi:MAG: hypothetical protein ACSHX9_09500 [Luteolibacter sp.]
MESKQIRKRLHEALLYLLWDQWVELGFEGHNKGNRVPFIIDPEALLLASLRFAMDEGRFGEAVSGWLHKNGEIISIQRLKNLQLATQLAPYEGLRKLSSFMEEKGFRNWKSLASLESTEDLEDRSSKDFSPNIERLISQTPDTKKAENLLLKMRLIFGVSARPEILSWMLTHRSGHAARIARETGWFSKSVQAILNDLEKAGMLAARTAGKRKEYTKSSQCDLWESFGKNRLRWFSQPYFYLATHYVLLALEKVENSDMSDQARAITLRNGLISIEASFAYTEHSELFAGVGKQTGTDLIQHFHSEALNLITLIETRNALGEA